MDIACQNQFSGMPANKTRSVFRQEGNGVRVAVILESERRNGAKKNGVSESALRFDGSSSSDSSCGVPSVKMNGGVRKKKIGVKIGKVAPDVMVVPEMVVEKKRCGWITPHSDPLYASFHDEEWGVPVHDDQKLFELLVLSGALAELSWPTILNKRDTFRELFANFDPSALAKFSERKILSLKACGNALLSEPKLRAVVENARRLIKVAEEFGSFSNYCWSFVNHKPIVNGFRYARQVPIKSPKAEAMSKDLVRRGFRCVGPSTIYSFMQVSGIVNDHLTSCFRYQQCNPNNKNIKTKVEEIDILVKKVENLASCE